MITIRNENVPELIAVSSSEHFRILRDQQNRFIICESCSAYAPIEDFIAAFESMVPVIAEHGVSKFIFDKRAMRAFHQPTMEWYFVIWKNQLLELGLSKHRKILPDEAWFRKCVEAGRASILSENPDLPFDRLDIRYYDSIAECIKN